MTAWDSNASGQAQLAESDITLYSQLAIFYATPELVADQIANIREEIGAAVIDFRTYSNLAAVTSALTELNDADSTLVVDSHATLTPAEYGKVATRTLLVNVTSGGMVDMAIAKLIGRNMGTSMDGLAIAALDAFGGTTIYPNAVTTAATLGTGDILDKTFAARLYNKLARINAPGILGGQYVAICHDDCLHDLRQDTAGGSWMDVSKYADAQSVLRGEVGMYGGIRWLRSSNATVTSNVAGALDSYNINVCGDNCLGKAVSYPPVVKITGPFDKLGRFLNCGWYGIFVYDTIDANNQVLGVCTSSISG